MTTIASLEAQKTLPQLLRRVAQGEEIVERDIGRSLHSSYDLHLCSAVPLTHEQYHCRRRLAVKQG